MIIIRDGSLQQLVEEAMLPKDTCAMLRIRRALKLPYDMPPHEVARAVEHLVERAR